jgi:6-pyruvoyltetrahydropterin/6-carboxytetrahydropterin synthase
VIWLTRRYHFPAAHVLASRRLSQEENLRIFGSCANPGGHGHNYGVEVTVTGPVDDGSGRIIPPELLDAVFEETVREVYSHRLLNDLDDFVQRVPTAENLARVIFDALAPQVARRSGARLARVRLRETPRNYFDYGGLE